MINLHIGRKVCIKGVLHMDIQVLCHYLPGKLSFIDSVVESLLSVHVGPADTLHSVSSICSSVLTAAYTVPITVCVHLS